MSSSGLPGVSRSFPSFRGAIVQVEDARVWGGIHFRSATRAAARMGAEVAAYVVKTRLLPLR